MSSLKDRIAAFEEVRDGMPYHINLADRRLDRSCVTKAKVLQDKFQSFGLAARRTCCRFKPEIGGLYIEQTIAPLLNALTHVWVKVVIPETGKEVDVDPTMDIGLKKAGFPVAEWNGLDSTILTVTPTVFFKEREAAQRIYEIDNAPLRFWKDLHEVAGPYVDRVNMWIATQRIKPEAPHA